MNALRSLLAPASIAVVGASAARATAGTAVIANLKRLGYAGRVLPVNPKYDEVDGLRCYPTLAAIPGDIDAAFLGVPAASTIPIVEECAARGIRTVVITASGFADAGPDGRALQTQLITAAEAAGISICGPNNMGVVNWLDGIAIWTGTLTPPPRTGPIGVISQSGSVSMLCAADDRNIGLGVIVGSGNEAVLTSAEYLDALVHDDRIHVVLHFLETIKRPGAYAAAAEEARRLGKVIITLKVGRTERGRQATIAHTGSLAGDDEEYDAFCRRYGLIRVATLDEMLELAELFTKAGRRPKSVSACLIAMSGGEVALLSDLATDAGLPLAEFSASTKNTLASIFPPYTTIANPLDAWGAGWNADAHRAAIDALLKDPAIGVIACAIDPDARNGRANTPVSREMAEIHRGLLAATPSDHAGVVFFNNVSAGLSPVIAGSLDGSGIPYLQGTNEALRAIAHWLRFHAVSAAPRALAPNVRAAAAPPPALAQALARMRGTSLDEHESTKLLEAFGIPVAAGALATDVAEAVRHAEGIGFPVVLKAASAQLPHKSDAGGVLLNVGSAAEVRDGFRAIIERMKRAHRDLILDGVLVARMIRPGLELFAGVHAGAYGMMVLVGQGGVDVEAHRDVAYALAPVDAEEADAMLGRLRIAPLLAASRGRPARDRRAMVDLVVRLSNLAATCAPWVSEIDLNPVIVLEEGQGAWDVDALVVPRTPNGNGGTR
jgi:acyl-CoA synthetase (NDP forming)